jgi:hypothetical protein
MNDRLRTIYFTVLAGLAESGPRPLQRRLELEAEGTDLDVSLGSLLQHLRSAGPNDPVKQRFSLQFALWDDADDPGPWTDGHDRRTIDRRNAIYRELGLPDGSHACLTEVFPIKQDRNVVIADDFEPWYTKQVQQAAAFYWPAYQRHLMNKPGWDAESVADLSSATTDIVQRLSDPARAESYQAKGLVVGYVQSGKTANITGVLAKAIDAGYRLLIVMTGTIDLLREQTQRRLDMELVGVENILRGVDHDDPEMMSAVDYQDDPDWDRFIRHGLLPSSQNRPDIIRLTNHRFAGKTGDYRSLLAGITALDFEKRDNTLPLNDRRNLDHCSARLVVVKKNARVLCRLVRDLKSIKPKLAEIPALLIDDESDHASVNTSNPRQWQQGRQNRTAINSLISQLLGLLPRAQYVGYTATPFANVFIDPDDAEDIFPKDFLIALSRPPGYMGASDFHDLDPETDDNGRTVRGPREQVHVRDLVAPKDDPDRRSAELRQVLGMFLLTGAIKLFREQHGSPTFRHHTMLAHESVRRADHLELANEIREVWRSAGFSSPTGLSHLRTQYQDDIVPTSRAFDGAKMPGTFEHLKPFIGKAVAMISQTGDPVIIVNSDQDIRSEDVDFDRRPVWRVLVGGAKLSRGFTVEGLTVSYYRRKTAQADTLMQMGRWFGFRKGYQDLVRLYIDRRLQARSRTIDLYEAFGAIMYTEELFRAELRRYAELVNGKPQITPAQIPPLVTRHLPWLRPTARNKMFNARLVVRRLQEIEPVAYPKTSADIAHNYNAFLPLMQQANHRANFAFPGRTDPGSYPARYGVVAHEEFLSALDELRWSDPTHFKPDLAFLKEIRGSVDDWILLMPQLRTGTNRILPGLGKPSVFYRRRSRDPLFQAISDPKHRHAVRRIAGVPVDESYEDNVADDLHDSRRGAFIVYPIVEHKLDAAGAGAEIPSKSCIIGIRIVAPNSVRRPDAPYVRFRVHREDRASEIIVPNPEAAAD